MKVLFTGMSHHQLRALQEYLQENQKLRKVVTTEGDDAANSLALEVGRYSQFCALIVRNNYPGFVGQCVKIEGWSEAYNFVTQLKRL